jgi:hypothetical protein
MSLHSRFVATTKDDIQQTFVFNGSKTLDEVFAHVAGRHRGASFHEIADESGDGHKVFALLISRDESPEPTFNERIHQTFSEVGRRGKNDGD